MIKPTVGRVVLFYPSKAADVPEPSQPFAATVAFVHSDRCINIGYLDHNGQHHSACSVPLVQDDEVATTPAGYYAEWMPYQKGQAARTDAAEAGWKVQDPRPSVTEIEALMARHGEGNVRIEPNGDVLVKAAG